MKNLTILQALIYGIVQGITEFLPISSTAHLTLLPWLFNWKDPGAVFDVAVHLGTAAAVILFFIKDWIRLITAGFTKPKSTDGKLFWWVVAATIPGGIAGLLLDKYSENLRAPLIIGIMLIIMGVFLYTADRIVQKSDEIEQIGLKKSLIVGICQAFAIIPGVSRSGVTMTAGRFMGIKRDGIAKFTFLMSAPIILADGLYHLKKLSGVPVSVIPFSVAILTSAIVGALSIKFLLDYLKKKGFGIFAVYRFIFGAFIIILSFIKK